MRGRRVRVGDEGWEVTRLGEDGGGGEGVVDN